MDVWQIILVLIAAFALVSIIRNLRKRSAQAAEQRQVEEFRRMQAKAAEADRAEQAAIAAAAPVVARVEEPSVVDRGRGFLQEAADTAAGQHYERAASAMDEAAAELEQARQDADRAAQRLAERADEAMASIQAAASAHGGAVPGDGSHDCPAGYPIKGDMATKQLHVPGHGSYAGVIPEVCFQSVAAAEAAGFTEPGGAVVEDVLAAEAVDGPGGEPLEAVVAEAILIRDREDAAPGGVAAAAIAAADAGGTPPGAVRSDGSRECPPAYPIKGNRSSMLYLEPGSPTYEATVPEFCFARADAAQAAGYSATPF